MGRFRPGGVDKGVSFMIRGLAQLPERYRMLFVGGIKEEIEEMEALARSIGVFDRVTLRSFVPTDEVPAYACACNILAYVPETIGFMQRETLPMKLLEYMAARRARDVANRTLAATEEAIQTAVGFGDRYRAQAERQSRGLIIEQREIARETIRLMTGILGILRRQS